MNGLPDSLLLTNARWLDIEKRQVRHARAIRIENGVIAAIGERAEQEPAGDAISVDCDGLYLTPGFIDAHVHVAAAAADSEKLFHVDGDYCSVYATRCLSEMLSRGFTTVRDAGGAGRGIADALQDGIITGPRLLTCGKAIGQTGGHSDARPKTEFQPCLCTEIHRGIGAIVDGCDPARKLARELLRQGHDHIKIFASAGVDGGRYSVESAHFSKEELAVFVEEAHRAGTYVMAHAHSNPAIRHGVEAGVRTIEHGCLLDRETAQLLADEGVFYIPTLSVYFGMYDNYLNEGRSPDSDIPTGKLRKLTDGALEAVRFARDCGVKTGLGTDLFGELQKTQLREFSLRGEVNSEWEILESACLTNAQALMIDHHTGSIREGFDADILFYSGNPLEYLKDTERLSGNLAAVMQRGAVVRGGIAGTGAGQA